MLQFEEASFDGFGVVSLQNTISLGDVFLRRVCLAGLRHNASRGNGAGDVSGGRDEQLRGVLGQDLG